MSGINGVSEGEERITPNNENIKDAPTDKIDFDLKKLENRFYGMPGVAINLWNQLKKGSYVNKFDNLALSKMYIPLVEEGISYFKRMSGHFYLEENCKALRSLIVIKSTVNGWI